MTTPDFGKLVRKECPRYDRCKKIGELFYEDIESTDLLVNAISKTCQSCEELRLEKTRERSPDAPALVVS